jgi:chaperonin GroES
MSNASGIKPIGDKILVKPDPVETTTAGGIVIPDNDRKRQNAMWMGTFVEAGPNAWEAWGTEYRRNRGAPWAQPGDRVIFARYGGILVDGEDGHQYRILNDIDITTVVSEKVKLGSEKL